MKAQASFFEDQRLTMQDSIDLTAQSLIAYGADYQHWALAFSGGKDSTTTATVVAHLIAEGQVPRPETLTVLYADTRQELPPLQIGAMRLMALFASQGLRTQVVLPAMDDRYFVYMFGRGVPPPSNTFRWCTGQIKVEPMLAALADLRAETGEKILMITGVRVGESAARDQRIALSCGRNGAECGQGWFQEAKSDAIADTLAPILHWRVCHVWDWLMFEAPTLGYSTQLVAEVYGGEQAEEINCRTGCIGCPLTEKDTSLDNILRLPQWQYLAPLKRLRPLYRELKHADLRLRKDGTVRRKDGTMVTNPQRLGPLTMDARRHGLATVLEVQHEINQAAAADGQPEISLINAEEEARILELIAANTWPQRWDGTEVTGDVWLPAVFGEGLVQPLLVMMEE
jgi:DNA sulfur modification protein DndC